MLIGWEKGKKKMCESGVTQAEREEMQDLAEILINLTSGDEDPLRAFDGSELQWMFHRFRALKDREERGVGKAKELSRLRAYSAIRWHRRHGS